MSQIVIDCSVTMAWCFPDEADPYATAVLDHLGAQSAIVPAIWPLEVANVLVINERRGRINEEESARFIRQLEELPIEVEPASIGRAFDEILQLARRYGLTTYDAAYLELALRMRVSLCTFDRRLTAAVEQAGVIGLWSPE
jgi:predicted nucleic acid-binding protein